MNLAEQIKRNSLAVISLIVAFTALGYNTWRNELTESNRTVREAGFAMLIHIGELQRVSYLAHFDNDPIEGNPRKGWTEVLIIKDLGVLMPANVQTATIDLSTTWGDNWQALGKDDAAVAAVDDSIDTLRDKITTELTALD
jgi:hypothetical protein